MIRKGLLGLAVALLCLSLLVMSVIAQGDEDTTAPAVTVGQNVAAASVVQTVPVTLTLTIPGPDGPITVEVPIFLSLDIRIGISPELTPTLAVTPSVVTQVEATPTTEADDSSGVDLLDDSDESAADEEEAGTPTPRPTVAPPTATPVPAAVAPTATPLPTVEPTATEEPEAAAPICPDPRAVIVAPGVGQTISGPVNILGTASHENFLYYKVEYAQGENVDADNTFSYLADARVQVTGGLLASFDSRNLDNGVYTLKLTVVDASGNFPPPCTVSVVVAN